MAGKVITFKLREGRDLDIAEGIEAKLARQQKINPDYDRSDLIRAALRSYLYPKEKPPGSGGVKIIVGDEGLRP